MTAIPANAQAARRMANSHGTFAAAIAIVLGAGFFAATLGVESGTAPAYLLWAIVTAVGAACSLTAFYWRIRPIPPGRIDLYQRLVFFRIGIALITPTVATVLYLLAGHWSTVVLGIVWSVPGFAAAAPSPADYRRHQDLWDATLPMPKPVVWGAADPAEIPPWEDADGGHGHAIGHHGLH